MTFTTPTFLIFLVIVYALYWRMGRHGQNNLIFAASLVFYGWWDWRFLIMLLFIAGVDYLVARALMKEEQPQKRRMLLGISLATNLGALGFFKYFSFFQTTAAHALAGLGVPVHPLSLQIILPVGISFYTFQALSYTIDVYRRVLPAVDDVVQYFSFITFFPHMVAGPIQQAKHLLVQFAKERHFDLEQSSDGLRQMLWGFFKKMVVADNLAMFVNRAYGDVHAVSGWNLWWATYFFAFQIYCDFSGYTDIAIGCARLFGLQMTRNFAYPYFSQSIPEFWRRWHISLSTWFREYLYIPLGGNRVTKPRQQLNVIITFVVSGFWHGANWTFIVWGFLHGLYCHFYSFFPGVDRQATLNNPGGERLIPSLHTAGRMLLTFHLVCLAWIFFRAASLAQALTILSRIGGAFTSQFERPPFVEMAWIGILLSMEWFQRRHPHALHVEALPKPWRWACYYVFVALIIFFAQLSYTPFIYFQF